MYALRPGVVEGVAGGGLGLRFTTVGAVNLSIE